ncbi:MAG: hypothetical protein H6734_27960 [Alphaproteobacteria bacterium]|nr:hypothetical protein [Alphaproteobacteria bacterium]
MRTRALVGVLCLIVSCGKSEEELEPLGPPVTQVIGPDGGQLEVAGSAGTLTLEVPPGALEEDTTLVITPVEADEGEEVRYRMEPAGLVPLIPLVATFEGDGLTADHGFRWIDSFGTPSLQGGEVGGGRLEASLVTLGYPSDGVLRAASPPPAGATDLAVAPIDCKAELERYKKTLEAGPGDGTQPEVAQAWADAKAIANRCDAAQAAQEACDAYHAAEAKALAATVTDEATFQANTIALMQSMGSLTLLAATCDTSKFQEALDRGMEQFIASLEAHYAATDFGDDLDAHLDEFRRLVAYDLLCANLGVDESVCQGLHDDLLPGVLGQIRLAAFRDCQVTRLPTSPADLHTETILSARQQPEPPKADQAFLTYGRFTYGDLAQDVDHCASNLEVRAYAGEDTALDELESERTDLGPGEVPGSPLTHAGVKVPLQGSITLGGRVTVPPCPSGGARDTALVVRTGGQEIARRPASGDHFTVEESPFILHVPDILEAADRPSGPNTVTLDVTREGGSCEEVVSPTRLYDVTLETGDIVATVALAAGWTHAETQIPVAYDCNTDDDTYVNGATTLPADLPSPATTTLEVFTLNLVDIDLSRVQLRYTLGVLNGLSGVCPEGTDYAGPYATSASATGEAAVLITPRMAGTVTLGQLSASRTEVSSYMDLDALHRMEPGLPVAMNNGQIALTPGTFLLVRPLLGAISEQGQPIDEVLADLQFATP